jgi:hypothetical protein
MDPINVPARKAKAGVVPTVSARQRSAERSAERKARIAGNFRIKEVGAAITASFTILKTDYGIVTKEIFLGDAGECVKKSTPNFSGGTYEVRSVASLEEFAAIRRSLEPDQALMYSTPLNGTRSGIITTKKRRSGKKLSRSKECFEHPAGWAILTIDYDSRSGSVPHTQEQLVERFIAIIPALADTVLLWATSAGSCIWDIVTGKECVGVSGQRIYILVKDGRDIKRALQVIAERCWLAGDGWIKVSKSGAKLKRTLVDLAMANGVQPDFAAGAVCHYPFEQLSQQKLIGKGGPLDTAAAIPDLTAAERRQLEKIYAEKEQGAEAESQAARALWLIEYGERAVRHAAASGRTLSEVEIAEIRANAVATLDSGILTGDFLVTMPDRSVVTVADILGNLSRYHQVECLDPLEPEYDDYRVVGMIYTDGNPCIYSYAHGGQTFQLVRDKSEIETVGKHQVRKPRLIKGIPPHFPAQPVSILEAKSRLSSYLDKAF